MKPLLANIQKENIHFDGNNPSFLSDICSPKNSDAFNRFDATFYKARCASVPALSIDDNNASAIQLLCIIAIYSISPSFMLITRETISNYSLYCYYFSELFFNNYFYFYLFNYSLVIPTRAVSIQFYTFEY